MKQVRRCPQCSKPGWCIKCRMCKRWTCETCAENRGACQRCRKLIDAVPDTTTERSKS